MLDVAASDILELMAAASFFQLETLLRYTESRCSQIIDTDNVVAMYIHAKVISVNMRYIGIYEYHFYLKIISCFYAF